MYVADWNGDSLREVPKAFQFPLHFVNLISECVSSSKYSMLLNGVQGAYQKRPKTDGLGS